MTRFSDDDIDWLCDRVCFYIREKHFTHTPAAIRRALSDFRRERTKP